MKLCSFTLSIKQRGWWSFEARQRLALCTLHVDLGIFTFSVQICNKCLHHWLCDGRLSLFRLVVLVRLWSASGQQRNGSDKPRENHLSCSKHLLRCLHTQPHICVAISQPQICPSRLSQHAPRCRLADQSVVVMPLKLFVTDLLKCRSSSSGVFHSYQTTTATEQANIQVNKHTWMK